MSRSESSCHPSQRNAHVAGVTPGFGRGDHLQAKFLETRPGQGGQAENMIVHLFAAQYIKVAESVDKGV